jgi:sugar phosphate isomerase/epimerase/RimJ/RimL family protein N-acetyltransferase
MQFGLKLGSTNTSYTEDILSFYEAGYFQYIELFAAPGSFNNTIEYWKQFQIPIIIHAPHSFAGMNISLFEERENNKKKLQETFQFADALKSETIIFHSGVNGKIEETINQLRPFVDSRCVIENKPMKGLNGEKCLGSTPEEIKYISDELKMGFCLDFGHAICAANSMKKEPLEFIKKFLALNPRMYHLTDGDYSGEYDSHLHYGNGTFPVKELLKIVPNEAQVTNEAKHDSDLKLDDFKNDYFYFAGNIFLRDADYSDMNILYEWANDAETRSNAFSTDLIPFDDHKKWFNEKLSSKNTLIFIYHCGEKNIGQIRFDIENDISIIDYTIAPSMRNQGNGYKMMVLAENKVKFEYPKIKMLVGEVKKENIASQNVFRKLNYNEINQKGCIRFSKPIQ